MANYVEVGDSDDESEADLSSSTISQVFDESDDDSDSAIDDAILADLKSPAQPRTLQGNAGEYEKPVNAGIHVWPSIKEALEHTFPGWPDSVEYETFCNVVRPELQKWKQLDWRERDLEGFGMDQSLNPTIDRAYKKFLAFDGNPLSGSKSAKNLAHYKNVLKIMAKGVKYLTADTRQKYEVALGSQITRKNRGEVFCTESLWNRKRKSSMPGSQLNSKIKDKHHRCIWVMTESAEGKVVCYSHFGKIGSFHHSSFTGGDSIMAAGEWYVEQGKCTLVNALSGHYKPESWRFLRALKVLTNAGVIRPETEVQVFTKNYPAGEERRLNAQEFINNWVQNMWEYQLHPDD